MSELNDEDLVDYEEVRWPVFEHLAWLDSFFFISPRLVRLACALF